MGLDFITNDPATQAFDTGYDASTRQRKDREAVGVDQAVRAGVNDMLNTSPSMKPPGTFPQDGVPSIGAQVDPASVPRQAPTAPPGVPPSNRRAGLHVVSADPTFTPTEPTTPVGQPDQPLIDPTDVNSLPPATTNYVPSNSGTGVPGPSAQYADMVSGPESGGQTNARPINKATGQPISSAYGPHQFLKDTWLSVIRRHRPDLATLPESTLLNMRTDPVLSKEMTDAYAKDNAVVLQNANVPVNDTTLYAAHNLGPGGAVKLYTADPNAPAAPVIGDVVAANNRFTGMTVAQVQNEIARRFNGGSAGGTSVPGTAGQVADASGSIVPAAAALSPASTEAVLASLNGSFSGGTQTAPGMPSTTNGRYDPILSRLAQTPGGGAAALQLLGQQQKYDISGLNRGTQYQRLAMTALGKGDVSTFQYYAQLGGISVPPEVVQNAGLRQKVAMITQLTHDFYKDDVAAGSNFARAYLQTGSIEQAFQTAGPPQDNPRLSLKVLTDGANQYLTTFNPRTGVVAGATDSTGATVPPIAAKPNTGTTFQTNTDGTRSPVTYNKNDPNAPAQVLRGPDGNPITQSGAANGRKSDRETRYQYAKLAGMTDQEAAALAAGSAPSAAAVGGTYQRLLSSFNASRIFDKPGDPTPEQKTEHVMSTLYGEGWRQRVQGGNPNAAPSAPQQQAPVAPPAPAASAPPDNLPFTPPSQARPSGPLPRAQLDSTTGQPPAQAVPQNSPQAPAQAAPAVSGASTPPRYGNTPPRPPNVPVGAAFSQSRNQWRDAHGTIYDANGTMIRQGGY